MTCSDPHPSQHDRRKLSFPEGADFNTLESYTRIKQAIAAEVQSLEILFKSQESAANAEHCRQLTAKLAEDRFTLAVMGQFNRGKSSLMNALVGRDLLPTGLLPVTSTITALKYGPVEKVTVYRHERSLPYEVQLQSLREYITEKGNPGNHKGVSRVCVELPAPFLKRDLDFVDTPGIGSAIQANSATTSDFLAQSDAVLYVTSMEAPLTQAEVAFLRGVRQQVKKIFFVVNKRDLVSDEECDEVLRFISQTLERELQLGELKMFPVSARMGLAAKLRADADGYVRSGLQLLEDALNDFLSREKGTTFLTAVTDRALSLAMNGLRDFDLQRCSASLSESALQEKLEELRQELAHLRTVRRERIAHLRRRLMQRAAEAVTEDLATFLANEVLELSTELKNTLNACRWELPCRVARRFASGALARMEQTLGLWKSKEVSRLNDVLRDVLTKEWPGFENELERISEAAVRIFGAAASYRAMDTARYANEPDIRLTALRRLDLHWKPTIPFLRAWLPLLAQRAHIAHALAEQLSQVIKSCAELTLKDLLTSAGEAAEHAVSRLTRVAEDEESRTLHLVGERDGNECVELPAGPGSPVDFRKQSEELARHRDTLRALRGQLIRQAEPYKENEEPPWHLSEGLAPGPTDQASPQKKRDKTLLDLKTRGCPVCDSASHAAFRFFAQFQYALATDEHAQRAYAEERGFCPLHAWQLASLASSQGMSMAYPKLVERIARAISKISPTGSTTAREEVLALTQNPENCRACAIMREAEDRHIRHLATLVTGHEGRRAYSDSQGVCLRHLGALLGVLDDKETAIFVLAHAKQRFTELAEDMRSYALKRSATRSDLIHQDEEDAFVRALVHLSGAKAVCMP
jgi:ribosome biogenesis GTPase A